MSEDVYIALNMSKKSNLYRSMGSEQSIITLLREEMTCRECGNTSNWIADTQTIRQKMMIEE